MYACKVLADSVGPHDIRLTTLEVTFPRPYLAEFNTHRMLSRNSESSRAIPIELQIKRVMEHPYMPDFYERVKGMGVGAPLKGAKRTKVQGQWLALRDEAVKFALANIDVAKDQVNRALEPFMWHTAIVSATEWDNFLNLRDHEDASGPLQKIARIMREALWMSEPKHVGWGGWHLPLVSCLEYDLINGGQPCVGLDREGANFAALVSAGRCARSSYSTHHNPESANESAGRWARLAEKGHWSPAEHPARLPKDEVEWAHMQVNSDGWVGNFCGWIQLRKHYIKEAIFR